MYGQLTLLVIAASIVSAKVIAIAGIIVAIVVVIGGVLVFRSGKNKGGAAPGAGNTAQKDWQRQSQQGAVGGWNPQGNMGGMSNDAPAWGQPNQQMGQGGWNNQGMPQQAQPGGWGNGQDVQPQAPSWASQPNQMQQPSWMQNAQQSSSPSWAPQGQQGQQPTPAPNSWGNQGFQAAQGQDSWGMQTPGLAQGQGAQQPPTAFGVGNATVPSWNPSNLSGAQSQQPQAAPNDAWSVGGAQQSQYASQPQNAGNGMGGLSAPANNVPQAAPSWAQSGFSQSNAAQGSMMGNNVAGRPAQQNPSFADNTMLSSDNDRTIIRTAGTGLGVVRVEEGKEPGREYEIRKESLSIGRSRESDIFLEDLAVSRLHASIVNQGNGNYALKDEGSANGTKVNGQLVGKYQTYPLQDGDRIQLGQTVLVFGHR